MAKELQITDKVLVKVEKLQQTGTLMLPKNYHAGNNVKAASLILQDLTDKNGRRAFDICTQGSIANSILRMVADGLSPNKHQCSFIIRGNKLCYQKEYAGNIAIAKRDSGLLGIPKAYTVYKGDDIKLSIDLETGLQKVVKYVPEVDNIKKENIKGAFAIARFEDGTTDSKYMTYEQIKDAWKMGPAKGNSPAHNNFPDQMCEKTVINRLLKIYVNSPYDFEVVVPHNTQTESNVTIDSDDVFAEAEEVVGLKAEDVQSEQNENDAEQKTEENKKQDIEDVEFTDDDNEEPPF